MKYYFSLFAIIVIVLSSCSENSTEPANTIQKSKEMPNFIFPLSEGNSWDYTEYKTNLKVSESKYYYDTVKYTLSVSGKEKVNWYGVGSIDAFRLHSSKNDGYNYLLPGMFRSIDSYKFPSYIAKNNDTLTFGYYSSEYNTAIYPAESPIYKNTNSWLPDGKRLNQKYDIATYDEVYIVKQNYNDEYRSEYHFVKGVGLVYWSAYDIKLGYYYSIGKLNKYSVK